MTRLAVLLGFQVAWFATAFAVTAKRPILGVAMSIAVAGAHLMCRGSRGRLAWLAVAAGVVGLAADTALIAAGLLTFEVESPSLHGAPSAADVVRDFSLAGSSSPLWMVLLWSNLALTVDALPLWISSRLVLTAAAGAVGGPLSYLAGERFHALHLPSPRAWSIAAVAIEWTLAMPALVLLERWIVSRRPPEARRAAL